MIKTMNNCDLFSSPIGLGHVTRDIAIVNNLKDLSVNFVTGSGAAQILKKLEHNVDDVYNPPSFVVENTTFKMYAPIQQKDVEITNIRCTHNISTSLLHCK